MLREHSKVVSRLVMVTDLALSVGAFLLAYYVRNSPLIVDGFGKMLPFERHQGMLYVVVPEWFLVFRYFGFYTSQRTTSYSQIFWMVSKALFVAVMILAAFIFFFKAKFFSRYLYLLFFFFNVALVTLEKWAIRFVQSYVRKRGYNYRNYLLVGCEKKLKDFVELMAHHQEWGVRIIGFVGINSEKELFGERTLGDWGHLPVILRERVVDEVVFGVPHECMDDLRKHIAECEEVGVDARILADFISPSVAKTKIDDFYGIPLVTYTTTPHDVTLLSIKRFLDIIGSAFGILVLSPLFAVVALAIKLTSPGPVLFTQERMGRNGRIFNLYKFRSMYEDAEKRKKELETLNERSGPAFKIRDDPRVTRVGKLIRKSSLDETPQFWNVLKGDMSLVGPRPPLPDEVKQYDSWQRRRLSMKPGLTCFWQIEGRNEIDFNEWMRLDLKYIDNWSLWLDLRILFWTVPAIVMGKGAS